MKEVIKFICEKCKSEYGTRLSAENCEAGHRDITDNALRRVYVSNAFGSYPYPESVQFRASDGALLWYRFVGRAE